MNERYVFGLIDPRDHRIFYVGTLARGADLNEHVADAVAEARAGRATRTHDRVRTILDAAYEAPQAVVLQAEASEADREGWIELLAAAGNALTNARG
jgi:hypothetical protein